MAKVKGKIAAKVEKSKKAPVKAGKSNRQHGGFPTQAVIKLRPKITKKR